MGMVGSPFIKTEPIYLEGAAGWPAEPENYSSPFDPESIIIDGRTVLSTAWWLTVFSGMALAITTISFCKSIQSRRK